MRWIVCALIVLSLISAQAVRAADNARESHNYSIDLDWSKSSSEKDVAESLQSKGLLPVPMVRIGNVWQALVPATITLPKRAHVQIAVGITQFVERPLYLIDMDSEAGGSFRVRLSYPELTVTHDYSGGEGIDGALILKRIVRMKETEVSPGEQIRLPADPYAAIAAFAKNQKRGLLGVGSVPVLQEDRGKIYAPFSTTFEKYSFNLKQFMSAGAPLIYKQNIDEQWVLASWHDPLRAPPPEPIRLISKPIGAAIFVAGYFQGEMTETTIREPKTLWAEIMLRKHGFADCPVDSAKVVHPPGKPATFSCKLIKE